MTMLTKLTSLINRRILGLIGGSLLVFIGPGQGALYAAVEPLSEFGQASKQPPAPWHLVRFDDAIPATEYRIIRWDGFMAIEAQANASMALLARPLVLPSRTPVDLNKTPILCWQWRVDAPLKSADMTKKSGDDYAARVYLAFDLPDAALSFGTKLKLKLARSLYGDKVPEAALNYVWDNRHPIGTRMANAYTERTQMLVLRTGSADSQRWVSERVNILADAVSAFGSWDYKATLLAVAADTDNTGEQARAGFTGFHFVDADTACNFTSNTASDSK